ncbi:MAG: hypothetical protein ACUVWN_06710 [bacterium]
MLKYLEALEELPKELKGPIVKVLDLFREDIAETVKRSDFERFEKTTEENFNRVWRSIEELTETQKRTEQELTSLTRTVRNMQKEIGGLSNTIGYELEDNLYPLLQKVLKEDFGVVIEGDLERTFIQHDQGGDEVNIYGNGRLDGRKVHIIGESKVQIGKGDVEGFVKMVKRLSRHLREEILPISVCYTVYPKVEAYIK